MDKNALTKNQLFQASANNVQQSKGTAVSFSSIPSVADIHAPTFKEDKKSGIFRYGENNLYPDFLLDLYLNKSGKHRSIIEKKATMTAGHGFEFDESNEGLKNFIENSRGSHNLNAIAFLNALDNEVFYFAGLIVRWNADRSKIAAIDFVPAHKIRKGIAKKTWFISDNWQHYKKPESKTYKVIEMTSPGLPNNWNEMKKEERELHLRQIVLLENLTIGSDAYPFVPYAPFIHYLLADYQVGKFTLNNVKNGYTGGYHVDFVGEVPEPEKRSETKRAFLKEYTNNEHSNIVFTWTPPESTRGTTLTPLPTNGSENAFIEVDTQILDNIFIAHRVTSPLLFGFREPGSLGGKQELIEALEIMQATEINPKQENIEKIFNKIAAINGFGSNALKLKKFTI